MKFQHLSMIMLHLMATLACGRTQTSKLELSQELWARIEQLEEQSEYVIALDAETISLHQENLSVLRDKIPDFFPEPYLPYARLLPEAIDPSLSYEPKLTQELITLGEKLFFDTTLSYSQKSGFEGGVSCASCHKPEIAFADELALSLGVDGHKAIRNSPSLINVAYFANLTWIPLFLPILEKQADIPLFGDDPIEMGLRGKELQLPDQLIKSDPEYFDLFASAFPETPNFRLDSNSFSYYSLTAALAAYQRSLISFENPVDKILTGVASQDILDPYGKEGLELFLGLKKTAQGETLACSRCHSGFNFSDSYQYVRGNTFYRNSPFHQATHEDAQVYRTPSLRNVSKTAPYGHKGDLEDLDAVLDFYQKGSRPGVDTFEISEEEKIQLLRFLSLI